MKSYLFLCEWIRNPRGTHTFHFEFLCQYSIHWHFWHVQDARQCSNGQISIVLRMEATVLASISITKVFGLSHCSASWTDFQPSLNSLCYFLMLELLRHSCLKDFFINKTVSFDANVLLGFQIHFFATQTTLHLVYTVSLPACKNHIIHRMMFVLVLSNPVCKMKQHCDGCTYVGRYYSTAIPYWRYLKIQQPIRAKCTWV